MANGEEDNGGHRSLRPRWWQSKPDISGHRQDRRQEKQFDDDCPMFLPVDEKAALYVPI